VEGLLLTPLAVLLEFDLALHLLLVLIRVIITPLANGATERDQFVCALYFGHGKYDNAYKENWQIKKGPGFDIHPGPQMTD
jgi:hypothetical protein